MKPSIFINKLFDEDESDASGTEEVYEDKNRSLGENLLLKAQKSFSESSKRMTMRTGVAKDIKDNAAY